MKGHLLSLLLLLAVTACAPNTAERNNAGGALYDQGDYTSAVNAYQAAQVLSPNVPEPYFNAANALARIGNLQEAVSVLKQALKTSDESLTAKAYYNLGNVYYEMGRYDDAVLAYQQTLLVTPNDEDARYNLELALRRIPPPSPTPSEEQGLENTPTPNPGDGVTPSPQVSTPTPQFAPDQSNGDIPPAENTMTVEQSEQLLDSVQQDQGRLPDRQQPQPPGDSQPQMDW